ncbi:helix-turn-helix domain-containing protein [Cellulosimicrobium aquatile]|uniref:helix-turn-helix domain-containing protein n=1 Tax=Cellulosimicrobium aquatile TaxID=1612203 RepID=UPI0014597BFB|nr:helix-turn-helix domain-containing protein [Cellulosimicrobium aquatile]NMF29708.1 helix-turn-helix domain-containing protein [Cellulosimicrobium aquatile]
MGNGLFEETVRAGAVRRIVALLPSAWTLTDERGTSIAHGLDGAITLHGPRGTRALFSVEVKRAGAMPVRRLVQTLREAQDRADQPVLFLSDYVGPSLRAALDAEGLSYADTTGWVRVVRDKPLIVLRAEGADRSPRARASSISRFDGLAANRVIRALSETKLPVGVRELAANATVAPGSVSKMLATLTAEGVVDRDDDGRVSFVRRRGLIHRWVRDYSFITSNKGVMFFLAPRGIERALASVNTSGPVTITGSAAARRLLPPGTTPVVPLRLLTLYAPDPSLLQRSAGLLPVDRSSANVIAVAPQDREVLPSYGGDVASLAPTALVLADLLTTPGRSDAEAEQLMDALATHDPLWRE